jgi:hypothetical protein
VFTLQYVTNFQFFASSLCEAGRKSGWHAEVLYQPDQTSGRTLSVE